MAELRSEQEYNLNMMSVFFPKLPVLNCSIFKICVLLEHCCAAVFWQVFPFSINFVLPGPVTYMVGHSARIMMKNRWNWRKRTIAKFGYGTDFFLSLRMLWLCSL